MEENTRSFLEDIYINRRNWIEKYAVQEQLSLMDLCRLFNVPTVSMTDLLQGKTMISRLPEDLARNRAIKKEQRKGAKTHPRVEKKESLPLIVSLPLTSNSGNVERILRGWKEWENFIPDILNEIGVLCLPSTEIPADPLDEKEKRKLRVQQLAGVGFKDTEIAVYLDISPSTVKKCKPKEIGQDWRSEKATEAHYNGASLMLIETVIGLKKRDLAALFKDRGPDKFKYKTRALRRQIFDLFTETDEHGRFIYPEQKAVAEQLHLNRRTVKEQFEYFLEHEFNELSQKEKDLYYAMKDSYPKRRGGLFGKRSTTEK